MIQQFHFLKLKLITKENEANTLKRYLYASIYCSMSYSS